MKVRDVMKTSLRIAQYDSGLTAVARLMYESCWSVLRGVEIDLRVLRVIANRDICIVGGTMSQTIANILVGEVILGKFFACSPDHDIKTVLGIMKQANLQHLPVVNRNGSVRGMISISDAGLRAEQTACAGEPGFSYQEVVDTSSSICEPRLVDWPGAPLLEANETDDEDTTASESASRPVVVSIRSSTPVVNSGNAFYVAINLDGGAMISSSLVVLDFDANLIEVRRVANGGLLRGDPQFTTEVGKLRIRLEQSASNGGVLARGQLLLIVMVTKAKGQSALTLNSETSLSTPSNQVVSVRMNDGSIEVR